MIISNGTKDEELSIKFTKNRTSTGEISVHYKGQENVVFSLKFNDEGKASFRLACGACNHVPPKDIFQEGEIIYHDKVYTFKVTYLDPDLH